MQTLEQTGAVRIVTDPWDSSAAWCEAAARLNEASTGLVLIARPPCAVDLDAVRGGSVREPVSRATAPQAIVAAAEEIGLRQQVVLEDAGAIAERFFEAFGPESAKMRLEVIAAQPCPKFHWDHVFVRLLCTYAGPSTEYCLPGGEEAPAAFPPGWLGLLKGGRHPAYEGPTVLHRSPPLEGGQRRLSFVLDC